MTLSTTFVGLGAALSMMIVSGYATAAFNAIVLGIQTAYGEVLDSRFHKRG